jgi:transposase-like protein
MKIARKSDGRRIFTDAFKREQMDRVWHGELTLAELSRKLGIARSLLQRWKRMMPLGADGDGDGDGAVRGRVTVASETAAAKHILELQLLVGKQAMELELLRLEMDALKAELDALKKELNALKKGRRAGVPSSA